MSLRNIAITAPYTHNGVFQTLEQIVHFYNTRDVLPVCAGGNMGPGFWGDLLAGARRRAASIAAG